MEWKEEQNEEMGESLRVPTHTHQLISRDHMSWKRKSSCYDAWGSSTAELHTLPAVTITPLEEMLEGRRKG